MLESKFTVGEWFGGGLRVRNRARVVLGCFKEGQYWEKWWERAFGSGVRWWERLRRLV